MPISKRLLEILVCPADHAALRESGDELVCAVCGRRYEVRDSVPVFITAQPTAR